MVERTFIHLNCLVSRWNLSNLPLLLLLLFLVCHENLQLFFCLFIFGCRSKYLPLELKIFFVDEGL